MQHQNHPDHGLAPIIASPVPWVVLRVQITAFCYLQSATTGFIANVFPYRNRVSLQRRSKGLSRMTGNCQVRF